MSPCPFCGGAAHHSALVGESERVHCVECGVLMLGAGCVERWQARAKGRRTSLLPVCVFEFLPASFRSSDGFREAWDCFARRRAGLRKPLTARAAKLVAKDLVAWGVEASVLALDTAEKNGWLVPYAPKALPGAGCAKPTTLLL